LSPVLEIGEPKGPMIFIEADNERNNLLSALEDKEGKF